MFMKSYHGEILSVMRSGNISFKIYGELSFVYKQHKQESFFLSFSTGLKIHVNHHSLKTRQLYTHVNHTNHNVNL